MTLRTRLTVLVACATALLATAGTVVLVVQLRVGVYESLDRQLVARAASISTQLAPDPQASGFQDSGTVAPESLAQVIGPRGQLLESSAGAGPRPILTGAQLTRARSSMTAFDVTGPRGPLRVVAGPVASPARGSVIMVGASLEPVHHATRQATLIAAVSSPVLIALAALTAWSVAGAALRPVERMRVQAATMATRARSGQRVTSGTLRVPTTHDEIARLGHTLNELLDSNAAAAARQRAFVDDAGHELRTPLTALRAGLELAVRPGTSRIDLRLALIAAESEVDRLIILVEDLLDLARHDRPDGTLLISSVPLNDLVQTCVATRRSSAQARRIEIQVHAPSPVIVRGDAVMLERAIGNVLDNAIRFSPAHGLVEVLVTSYADTARIRVIDQGPGFAEAFLPHAFDRFAQADPARSGGSGLGLAITAAAMKAHHGDATVGNHPQGGGTATLTMPVVERPRPHTL